MFRKKYHPVEFPGHNHRSYIGFILRKVKILTYEFRIVFLQSLEKVHNGCYSTSVTKQILVIFTKSEKFTDLVVLLLLTTVDVYVMKDLSNTIQWSASDVDTVIHLIAKGPVTYNISLDTLSYSSDVFGGSSASNITVRH